MADSNINAVVGRIARDHQTLRAELQKIHAEYAAFQKACEAAQPPRSITEEIDAIPGRRIEYRLVGRVSFDITNDGQRGTPVNFLVSQDGPFIMTHYPLVMWKPSAPTTATQFGEWRTVVSAPLPTQQVGGDRIDLSYELIDGGSQRNFQNEAAPPSFSRPDNLVPLPVPTLFAPNTTVQFFPTYENIFFDPAATTPTTAGLLVVSLPGYKVVSM
jgi:hypothetical protein